MDEGTGILPGLPAVRGKPVHVAFDGGRLTSDTGIFLLSAIEQRLKIGERLAACLEDPRDPERVRHPGFTHQTALIAKPARQPRALVWKRTLTSASMKL